MGLVRVRFFVILSEKSDKSETSSRKNRTIFSPDPSCSPVWFGGRGLFACSGRLELLFGCRPESRPRPNDTARTARAGA